MCRKDTHAQPLAKYDIYLCHELVSYHLLLLKLSIQNLIRGPQSLTVTRVSETLQ